MPGLKKQFVDRSSDDETTDEENTSQTPTQHTGITFQDRESGLYERVTYPGVPHGAGVLLDDHPDHNLESHQPMTDPNTGRTFYSGTHQNMTRAMNAWRRGTAQYLQEWYDTSPSSIDSSGYATGGLRCDLVPKCKRDKRTERERNFLTLRSQLSHWKEKHAHMEQEDTDGKKGAKGWVPDYGNDVQFPATPHHWPADPPTTSTAQGANDGETTEPSRSKDEEQKTPKTTPEAQTPDEGD